MKTKIKKIISLKKNKTISSIEIYEEFSKTKIDLEEGESIYKIFYENFKKLEEEGFITPVISSGFNSMNPKLYVKYKKQTKAMDNSKIILEIQTKYNNTLNMYYFLNNIDEYLKEKEKIKLISNYLNNKKQKQELISINERSYQIFSDEKYLSSLGAKLLNNLGINLKDLDCYNTYEPFFYFSLKNGNNLNALIIENKDTFYSLKKLFLEGKNKWNNVEFDVLIYGEGNKITQSINFLEEIKEFSVSNLYYFGDLDYEGINIFFRLKNIKNEVVIFNYFYENLIDINFLKSRKISKNQKRNTSNENEFLNYFKDEHKEKIQKIFDEGKYIPQEGLSKKNLFEI